MFYDWLANEWWIEPRARAFHDAMVWNDDRTRVCAPGLMPPCGQLGMLRLGGRV